MSVFAIKDGIIAVDSLCTSGGFRVGQVQKWREVPPHLGGGFVVSAGTVARCAAIMELVAAHGHNAQIDSDEDCTVIWVKADATMWSVEKDALYEIKADFLAEGSGRQIAVGALAAGATPEEAARIAARHDTACGGDITVLRVA